MRKFVVSSFAMFVLAMLVGLVSAQDNKINPKGPPNFATVEVGGGSANWLDPFLVSTVGGVTNGKSVNAASLGIAGCTGVIPENPDVVVHWKQDPAVSKLRLFFYSNGDPMIVVVTPDGTVLCNDDVNPLVLDPMIDIENPVEGNYAVFMGSFENEAIEPGFLVITAGNYNPASLDLHALVPRDPNPDLVMEEKLPVSVLSDQLPADQQAPEALKAGFGKVGKEKVASGTSLGAFNIDLGNPLCTGFIDAVPNYSFEWSGESKALRVFFEGDQDGSLVIRTPDGSFQCNDDQAGAENLNPVVDLTSIEGRYDVYVGSFSPSTTVNGTLTVTEDTSAVPATLSSTMTK